MNCFQCAKWCSNFSELFSHFRHLHGLSSTGCEVHCTYGDCPRVFLTFQRLKDHALSHHKACMTSELTAESAAESVSANDTSTSVLAQTWSWSDHSKVNVTKSFMRFITTVGSKPGVSQTTLQNVTEELSNLVSDVTDYAVQTVNELCDELSITRNDPRVSEAVSKLNAVPQFISGVKASVFINLILNASQIFVVFLNSGPNYSTWLAFGDLLYLIYNAQFVI